MKNAAILALIGAGFGLILGAGFAPAVGGPWIPGLVVIGLGLIVISGAVALLPDRPKPQVYVVKAYNDNGDWNLYVAMACKPEDAAAIVTQHWGSYMSGSKVQVTLMDFHSSWRNEPIVLIATDQEMYV